MGPRKIILHTRKEKPRIPLSSQWWHSFHNKKPAWYGPKAWHPRTIDFGEMEQLKNVMLADLHVVVIGGSHRYYSPDDLAAFFSPSNEDAYNKHIDVGHVADFFLGGSQGGAIVLHFPAIDSQEMVLEARDSANRTGDFIDLSETEVEQRVATLFRDEIVKLADAIVINQEVSIPIPDDGNFETYIKYLGGINQRANRVICSICCAWQRSSQPNSSPRRIIVLRNSSFWLSSMHSKAFTEESENTSRQLQPWEPTEELQSELSSAGIELVIRMAASRPHDTTFVESDWRSNSLNDFFNQGHRQSVKRQMGIDLATSVAYGDDGPSEDEIDELYDRVLECFMPTCLSKDNSLPRIQCVERNTFLQQCVDAGIGWRSSWLDDDEERSDAGQSSSAIDEEATPLAGLCALVLDNGRNDSITAACCEGLSKLGVKLALSFTGNDHDDGATVAEQLVERLCQTGGKVLAVRGIPHRSKLCSAQPNGVRFIEEMIDQALHDLGHNQIDIVVNNVGWAYSLVATQPSYEKRRFMDRDSRRNLLALNYTVMYLVQNKLISKGARVINIAGISCNPATGLTGDPHWKCLALFMQKWYNWTRDANAENSNGAVEFTSINPGTVICDTRALDPGALYKIWETTVVDTLEQWQTELSTKEVAKVVKLLVHPKNRDVPCLRGFLVSDMIDSEASSLDDGVGQSWDHRELSIRV